MDMEKRLAQIERPIRDANRAERTRTLLMAKQAKYFQMQLWTRRFVLASILMLALFFVITSNVTVQQKQAYTPFTADAEIEKIYILRNETPNRHLNASSIFYPQAITVEDRNSFIKLQTFLQQAVMANESVVEKINDEVAAYEYFIQFSNEEVRQLKLVVFDEADYLYDTKANGRYKLTQQQYLVLNHMQYAASKKDEPAPKWKLLLYLLPLTLLLLDTFIIQKRYLLIPKKEANKIRRESRTLNAITASLAALPAAFSQYLFGATHFGLILCCCILSFALVEYTDVKQGIKRANLYSIGIHICVIVTLFTLFFI